MAVQIRNRERTVELIISDRFNFDLHVAFREASQQALALEGIKTLEVHLADVDYLDSSALGMLIVLKKQANAAGIQDVVLVGPKGMVREVLDIARFDKLFPIRQ